LSGWPFDLLLIACDGRYDVTATEDHTAFGHCTFTTTMKNSILNHSPTVEDPERFSGQMIAAGAPE
jgi:hypothetical protein